jgi:DNA-binding beta-propeller fold protein YncE
VDGDLAVAIRSRGNRVRYVRTGLFASAIATGVSVLAFAANPAFAVHEYSAVGSFGEGGSGAGQLLEPRGVAVNDVTGDVYVADKGNARVDEFSASGTFVRAWGWEVNGVTGFGECTLICQPGAPGSEPGQFQTPGGVAVDNSADSSTGDVYVSDPENHRIQQFSADGEYIGALAGTCENLGEAAPCPGSSFLPFSGLHGLVVDPAGNLWVYGETADEEEGRVAEFSAGGVFIKAFGTGAPAPRPGKEIVAALTRDSRGDLFLGEKSGEIAELDSTTGARLGEKFQNVQETTALAVDPTTDKLLVDNATGFGTAQLLVYPPFAEPRTPLQVFPAGGAEPLVSSAGIGVSGSSGAAYEAQSFEETNKIERFDSVLFPTVTTEVASSVAETSATLNGSITPEGESITACEFEYGPEEAEPGTYPDREPCSPPAPLPGMDPRVTVSANVTGLEPRHTYHYRLSAENKNGARSGVDGSLFTVTKPVVAEEGVSHSAPTTADVGASIDAAGLPTTYSVEYGTSEAYGQSTPEQSMGNGTEAVAVSAALAELRPSTSYHFRFVARNEVGTTVGPDVTFSTTTATGAGAGLPDNRAYERVSPGVAEVYTSQTPYLRQGLNTATKLPMEAAVGGDAVAYAGEPDATGGNGAIGEGQGDDWLGKRGAEGWEAKATTPVGSSFDSVFQAFSDDLSSGILATKVQPPLASGAPPCTASNGETDLYSRDNAGGTYQALFTSTNTPDVCGHPLFAGSSVDRSKIIFQNEAALTENAALANEVPPGHENHQDKRAAETGEPCVVGCDLYESTHGHPRLVSVLPGGTVVADANFGGFSRAHSSDFSNAMSADGSRIFWTDTQEGPEMEHIYVMENEAAEVQVSGEGPAEYWTATSDGRFAFYSEGGELWRFDTSDNTRQSLVSTDLAGENPGVQGVLGANTTGEDGAYIYIVANGVLTESPNARGEQAVPGDCAEAELSGGVGCNLYLLHGSAVTFIATLAREDNGLYVGRERPGGDWTSGLFDRTAEVTPDGLHLVFDSVQPLTGYDNVVPTGKAAEAFVFSADHARLACASCEPTGAPPQTEGGGPRAVPPASSALPIGGSDTRLPRWASDDGSRVFLETAESLVPADTNGVGDVYEWEQEGTSACPIGTSINSGCLFLLSGGQSSTPSSFVDASASGGDVFFTSRAALVPQDRDEKTDLYDAHECTETAPCPHESSTACANGCEASPPAQPTFVVPSSATFSGAGNLPPFQTKPAVKPKTLTKSQKLDKALKACKRYKAKQRRARCQRAARKRYGVAKAKKKTKGTRAERKANQ